MRDYNVAYGANRALKRMKRTRKEFTPTSRYKSIRLSKSLYYFNNKEQGEADFVIEFGDGTVLSIEVKSGKDYEYRPAPSCSDSRGVFRDVFRDADPAANSSASRKENRRKRPVSRHDDEIRSVVSASRSERQRRIPRER